jgi:hypothetical protein
MTHPNIPLPHNGIVQGMPMMPNLMTGINDIHGITNKI